MLLLEQERPLQPLLLDSQKNRNKSKDSKNKKKKARWRKCKEHDERYARAKDGEPIELEDRRQESWTRRSQQDSSTNAAVDEVMDFGELAQARLDSHQEKQRIKATVDTGAGV